MRRSTDTRRSIERTDMTERYAGPSAARIADPMLHRVGFDRGWFWTTIAIHHGEGIDPH